MLPDQPSETARWLRDITKDQVIFFDDVRMPANRPAIDCGRSNSKMALRPCATDFGTFAVTAIGRMS